MSSYFEECIDPFQKGKNDFLIKAEHLQRYIFAKDILSRSENLIIYDVASGSGYGTKILSRVGKVYGFDKKEIDLDKENLVSYVEKNKIPKPRAVVCFETLEHLENPQKLLEDFHELLPKNGLLIISVPNAKFEPKKNGKPKNIYHKHLFLQDDLVKLVEQSGFKVKNILGQPFSNILLHKVKWLVKLLDNLSQVSQGFFIFLSLLVASPTKILTDKSYSIIIVARKN